MNGQTQDNDRLWITCGTKNVPISDGLNPIWFESVIVYELWIGSIPPEYSPAGTFVTIDNSRCRCIKEVDPPRDIKMNPGQRAESELCLQWGAPVGCSKVVK